MKEEFNLSEKIEDLNEDPRAYVGNIGIRVEDVKEFIKRLKGELQSKMIVGKGVNSWKWTEVGNIIDKLAGEELT